MVVIGSTGMLGKAIVQYSKENGLKVFGISRNMQILMSIFLTMLSYIPQLSKLNPELLLIVPLLSILIIVNKIQKMLI